LCEHPTRESGHPPSATQTFTARLREGRDYRIIARPGQTGALIMAPHGGGIEPGTHRDRQRRRRRCPRILRIHRHARQRQPALHLPSTRFDEPRAMALAAAASMIVVIHGCREPRRIAYLGGRDAELRQRLARRLAEAGIATAVSKRFPGQHEANLCNRFPGVRGVQLELSTALRDDLTAAVQPLSAVARAVHLAIGDVLPAAPS
jgi:phage replication-related protein YjqB (UPF0714/DUF867 family)